MTVFNYVSPNFHDECHFGSHKLKFTYHFIYSVIRNTFEYYETLFENACKQLCEDLNFDYNVVTYDNERYEDEYFFSAEYYKGEKGFNFDVTLRDSDNSNKSDISITIYFSKGASPFYFQEKIEYLIGHSDFLARWAAWAVFNYKRKHEQIDLQTLFHEAFVQVYGIPYYDDPAITEIEIFLSGVKQIKEELLIYKFRHLENDFRYRRLSYAFCVPAKSNVWVFFPACAGLDSGAARRNFKIIESLIMDLHDKVTRKNFDIEYVEFAGFLSERAICFTDSFTSYNELDRYINNVFFEAPTVFGSDFESAYSEFIKRLRDKRYSDALRDLRALVQHALEKLVEKNSISLRPEPKIHELVSSILDSDQPILDEKLRYWFSAFTDVANRTTHSAEFPSQTQMSNTLFAEKIFLTIRLGIHLISEIEYSLSDKKI